MDILTLQEYFFFGILGFVILIVFFVMASNLRKIRNNTEENKEILTKILELKEQELKLSGIEPFYSVNDKEAKERNESSSYKINKE